MIHWSTIRPPWSATFLAFFYPHEHIAAYLSEWLLRQKTAYQAARGTLLVATDNETIVGCILYSADTTLYPVWDSAITERIMPSLIRNPQCIALIRHVGAIIGASPCVQCITQILAHTIRTAPLIRTVDHHLFTRDAPISRTLPPLPHGYTIHHATVAMIPRIAPLQKKYMREEMEPHAQSNYTDAVRHLYQSLTRHIVYVMRHRERIVAKVATNAHGLRYDQIGGVYTDPAHRRIGIATHLMSTLLMRITAANRHATLFVRATNTPACALYRALHFTIAGRLTIAYIEHR